MRETTLTVKKTFSDVVFLKKVLQVALPIAMQGLLNSIVNLVDNLMIGNLGETSIAAVGLANKVFFVFSLLVFGVCSGSGVLSAQFWGKRDLKNMRRTLGMALTIVISCSLLFVIPSVTNPHIVMRIFTESESTIAEGCKYLSIAALTYPLIAISNAYAATLRAANCVKAPMYVSLVTIMINVCLNYILIFGHFGFEAMGVAGAATATLTARSFEAIALVTIVYVTKSPAACRISELFGFDLRFTRLFAVTAAPVIANEFMWGLGTTIYSLVYGRMGDGAVAAVTIATTITDLLIVFFQGTSNACAVILGNELGADHLERAESYAKKFVVLQLLASFVIAILMVIVSPYFIDLFAISQQVMVDVRLCILMFALFMPIKMYNYVNIVGILRSGGDTKYCLFLDCFGVWAIGIPLAFIGGLWLEFPIWVVFALVMFEEFFKMVLGIRRYKKKIWLRNLTF